MPILFKRGIVLVVMFTEPIYSSDGQRTRESHKLNEQKLLR